MLLKRYLPSISLLCFLAATVPCYAGDAGSAGVSQDAAGVDQIQQQMLADPGIMALIQELQSDPQMQGLLSDPKAMDAVLSGDVGFLLKDPRFRRLLDSRQVKDIGKKLEKRNAEEPH
jgi:hypothetical protein